ncbi:ORF6N domain-containing protein [Fibrobacter sp.]|uniref:ORF6N domain-containing protein n=1 Tax=Fibrobacter sp. TaxID=35828 RepID=UPI00388F249C
MAKKEKKKELDLVKPSFSLIDENLLKSRIYTIRGVKVMLDADLAEIYGYSTKAFNQQVKNNIERFAEDFRFQLSDAEILILSRSKFLTSIQVKGVKGGRSYKPYAFTEQGIYMLMTVLKGVLAVQQSMALIRLFKRLKDYAVSEGMLLNGTEVTPLVLQTAQNTRDIADVSADVKVLSGEVHEMRGEFSKMNMDLQKVMENFVDPSTHKHFLILNGQRLDADIAFTQIYGMAKKSITIIDDYIGVKTLDLLRQIAKGVSVTIYSDNRSFESLTKQMQKDFLAVRPDVKLAINKTKDKFHDRYIFLDYGLKSEKLFHCGASSKDAGNKITTIMQIEYTQAYHCIMEMLKKGLTNP